MTWIIFARREWEALKCLTACASRFASSSLRPWTISWKTARHLEEAQRSGVYMTSGVYLPSHSICSCSFFQVLSKTAVHFEWKGRLICNVYRKIRALEPRRRSSFNHVIASAIVSSPCLSWSLSCSHFPISQSDIIVHWQWRSSIIGCNGQRAPAACVNQTSCSEGSVTPDEPLVLLMWHIAVGEEELMMWN